VVSIELSWDSVMNSRLGNWKNDKKKKMCHLQHQFDQVEEGGGPRTTASSRGAASCGAIDHGFALRILCKAECGDIKQFVVEELQDKKSGHRAELLSAALSQPSAPPEIG
jgi:hypothetical protein